jgi:hypothetical protein
MQLDTSILFAALLFILQANGIEMNWELSVGLYSVIAVGSVLSCLRHAVPHLGRTGRYVSALGVFVLVAILGLVGTVKQYRREHQPINDSTVTPTPQVPHGNTGSAEGPGKPLPVITPQKTAPSIGAHPLKPRSPESSIQYTGVSVGPTMPAGSVPGFDLKLNFRVSGPTSVYHVKTWSDLVMMAPLTAFSSMSSKLYRAFQSQAAKNPNTPETPEIGPSEISIKPKTFAKYSSSAPYHVVFVFSRISWLDRAGIAGEINECLVTPDSSKIDAQTEWLFCESAPATAVELKYESMTSAQLLDEADGKSSALRHSTDIEHLCDEMERGWPNKDAIAPQNEEGRRKAFDEYSKSIKVCLDQIDIRVRGIVCPEVAPLVEEMMFRIGYSPLFFMLRVDGEQPRSHPSDPKTSPVDRTHEESMLSATVLGCQSPRGSNPSLEDTSDSLEMLTTALREAVKEKFSAPFDSRQLE